jgi:hypothetical protein
MRCTSVDGGFNAINPLNQVEPEEVTDRGIIRPSSSHKRRLYTLRWNDPLELLAMPTITLPDSRKLYILDFSIQG